MASNSIVLKDTTYNGVSSIEVPVSGGGSALFTDVSDTTAAAADVAQGKYFYASDGTRTVGSYTPQSSTLVTKSITANGTYDATDDSADGYSEVTVNVQPSLQAKTNISPTNSSQTIQPDNGYYGLSSVQINAMPSGTAGTPTATKGTVSNNSVSVTPSVTNTTGYITGSTKTGTAVTVSASELVSGTKSITANGTGIDVMNYAAVDVAVNGDDGSLKSIIERTATTPTLPSDLTKIGDYAFYNCSNLELASLPSGVTNIGSNAFYMCSKLALTSLPSGVTKIGVSAFNTCSKLALTSLPSTLTVIESNAFASCVKLVNITCTGRISTLGSGSFSRCSGLHSVEFPNCYVSSLSYAFGNTTATSACRALETVDIGSISAISANAFANCYKLQTLVLRKTGSICTLANVSAFLNTPMRGYNSLTGTVYVPSALISSYQTASNWSTLYNNGTLTFAAIEGSPYEL